MLTIFKNSTPSIGVWRLIHKRDCFNALYHTIMNNRHGNSPRTIAALWELIALKRELVPDVPLPLVSP